MRKSRYSAIFLTSAVDGCVISSTPLSLYPKSRGTHWLGSWVDHRAGMDAAGNRTPAVQSASRSYTELSRLPRNCCTCVGHVTLCRWILWYMLRSGNYVFIWQIPARPQTYILADTLESNLSLTRQMFIGIKFSFE
jgi:hypothetical protein